MLHNQLIATTNPESENKAKITGIYSISINISGEGDESIELKQGTDPKGAEGKPWMPASVAKSYKQLFFRFIKAEELPLMDKVGGFALGTIDAYIMINHKG